MAYGDLFKLFETNVIADVLDFTGSGEAKFAVGSGSRAIVTLSVTAIDADTTISLTVKNGFGAGDPFTTLATIPASALGQYKQVFTDFDMLFDLQYVVTGGNATFKLVVTLADNASANGGSSGDLSTRQKILNASDTVGTVTWAGFGTDAARVLSVAYTSATYPGQTLTKTLTYTLTGGRYRFDSVAWTLE